MCPAYLEAVLEVGQHGTKTLLAIDYLANCAARFGVDVLTHVDLRDRLATENSVHEVRAGFWTPHVSALEFRREHQVACFVPFLKIPNAVIPGMKGLLHYFPPKGCAGGRALESLGHGYRCRRDMQPSRSGVSVVWSSPTLLFF